MEIIQGLYQGKPLLGPSGLLTSLVKDFTELALEGEMDYHLLENSLEQGSNRRNGINTKTMKTATGSFELETPRDRNGSFEPQLIKKRQTILNEELDNKILALYDLGTSYEGIAGHLQEIYGVEVSAATISSVTDKLMPQLNEWRSRPLEAMYAIVFLDAMFFKVRQDNKVTTKVVYNIMGIDQNGHKDILGFYACESEGSHFWLGVLNDLKTRGMRDILITCIDGLKGFPEAINTVFPKTEIQLCIVHQIRNSLKHVASKDQKSFMVDLKMIYQAESRDVAEYNLLRLEEKWGKKYPMVIKSWQQNWDNLATYFKYSGEVRKLIYTTNPIEGFHRQVRKYTKTKGAFTSENALFKLVFCAIKQITAKWNMPIPNWAVTVSQLDIFFPDRLNFKV
ncbi:IS256 family transposase [Candidatus Tisiphia endosymbiont of Nedyus quadrimaculatus]|uniref:IS256 family transposase n=1 Tax=Candidatus Tisiphia endosymbiont of Nedyus quadrimaculatus TaxID=3139332 RepID=UPI00345E3C4C